MVSYQDTLITKILNKDNETDIVKLYQEMFLKI